MSLRGNLNRLRKSIAGKSIPENTSATPSHGKDYDPKRRNVVIVEAINNTGQKLSAFTCVGLTDGDGTIPLMAFPEAQDDKELTQYGSVLNDVLAGEVGHVQVSGECIYRVYSSGAQAIVVGEIVYPLANVTGKSGLVSNKASADSDLIDDIPLGRSLQTQTAETELITVNGSGVGGTGGGADVEVADYISTSNVSSKTGNPTLDNASSAVVSGDIVFLQNQTTISENGLWTIPSGGGAWTQTNDAPDVVFVRKGGNNRLSIWIRVSDNTFYRHTNLAKYTSTANRSSLSGTTNTGVDFSSTLSVGDLVLLKNQSTASQNGLYIVQSGTWIKIGQPQMVQVTSGTTLAGVTFFLSGLNTYTGGKAVYA